MINQVALLGEWGINNLRELGKAGILLGRVLFYPPNFRKGFPLVIQQIYAEGVLSLLIIIVSSLFIGSGRRRSRSRFKKSLPTRSSSQDWRSILIAGG